MRVQTTTASNRIGVAAAELALMLPFLGLIFFTVLDYARVLHYTQVVQSSADNAAKYASGQAEPAPYTPGDNLISIELGELELLSVELEDGDNEKAVRRKQMIRSAIEAAVREGNQLNPPIQPKQIKITYSSERVTVTISYSFQTITPFLSGSRIVQLNRRVVMPLATHAR